MWRGHSFFSANAAVADFCTRAFIVSCIAKKISCITHWEIIQKSSLYLFCSASSNSISSHFPSQRGREGPGFGHPFSRAILIKRLLISCLSSCCSHSPRYLLILTLPAAEICTFPLLSGQHGVIIGSTWLISDNPESAALHGTWLKNQAIWTNEVLFCPADQWSQWGSSYFRQTNVLVAIAKFPGKLIGRFRPKDIQELR